MKIVTTFAAAAVAACMFAAPSLASALTLQFDNVFGESVYVSSPSFNSTTSAGRFNWTVVAVADNDNPWSFHAGDKIITFCCELQGMGSNPHDYEFAESPKDVPGSMGGMGENKAKVLTSLFWNNYATAATGTKQEAAAFQMCVWEIVYETIADINNPSASLDVGDGVITIDAVDDETDALANSWLENVYLASQISDGLLGLANGQDQLYYVPVPAPVALAGVGLLGVIAGRKRLRALVS